MLIVDVCVCISFAVVQLHLFVHIVLRTVSQRLIVVVSVVQFRHVNISHI